MYNLGTMLDALLDRLFRSRERLLMALEMLPDEALGKAGVVGGWSVMDLLNVLTAWESELVRAMMRLEKGQKPDKLLAAMAAAEAFEARVVVQGRERDLDGIFDDWQGVRIRLEEWLEFFTERQLTSRKQFKWFRGKSLAQVVMAYSEAKELVYLPMVAAFAKSWADDALDSDSMIIAITAVTPLEDDDESD